MDKLPPNHNCEDQLPLYGLVYDAAEKKYDYTIGGTAIMMASRPFWEEVIELQEVKHAAMYVWLGVQSTSNQKELITSK